MTKGTRRLKGFTLVEVLIVVVIMAILAATIVPQFSDSAKDAKKSTAKFNLHTLRAQVEMYKSNHDGKLPGATLSELTSSTDATGTVGTGAAFPYGPYIRTIPTNPFNAKATIGAATADPPTADTSVGYLFNATTGKLYLNTNTDIPWTEQ